MDKIIVLTKTVTCGILEAYGLFARKKGLESWLAPKANVAPQVGGAYELFWDLNDLENDSTIGCCLTGFEPKRFLSFEWRSPRQFKHFAN
ncbi:MAG TPA: hypothetical protein PKO06_02205, partial [Candidatus Ozemobacteraceae bacterium]|nr:hypothetical protein [Candidatus Ozemobacteraceae bacterium]